MRRPRVTVDAGEGEAVYHCISRTAGGAFLFGEEEKEVLRRQMWALVEYCGLELVTYALMSNHIHLLVRVPVRQAISDADLLRRFRVLYPKLSTAQEVRLARVKAQLGTDGMEITQWRAQQSRQMFNVSAFMKLLKMRFSIWFNRRHERKGTLWSERFRSVLVQDGKALRTAAAYIDLNSVRAGLVADPKDYRFSGYAAAVAGNRRAQRGLGSLYGENWSQTAEVYRCILFAEGSEGKNGKACIPAEEIRRVRESGGVLPLGTLLRCRIRYFSDGAILGSESFVAAQIARLQKRKILPEGAAPRRLDPHLGWDQFRVLARMSRSVLG